MTILVNSGVRVKPGRPSEEEVCRALLIRDALHAAGVSLADVAQAAGVSRQAVSAAFGCGRLSPRIEDAATALLRAACSDDLGTLSFARDLLDVAEEAVDRGHTDRARRAYAAAWSLVEEANGSG